MTNSVLRRALLRITVLTVLAGLLLGGAFIRAKASDAEEPLQKSEEISYFGRAALAELDRAEVLLYAYDRIVEGVAEAKPAIYLTDGENAITTEEADVAFEAYRRDHTGHFWLATKYSIHYRTPEDAVYLAPTYFFEGAELDAAKEVFEQKVLELIDGIDDTLEDFDKELILHDRLAEKVTYIEDTYAHSAYGAIVEGKAVCEGYAEALQYLMSRVGIEGFIATGTSTNPTTGEAEGHAWNIFKIDGRYYHTDLTWNDQGETLYHAYFNLPESAITEDHTIAEVPFALPVSESTEQSYFTLKPGRLDNDEYSVVEIANLLREGKKTAHVYITGSTDTFLEWYQANISNIARECGVIGKYMYSYAKLGREVVIAVYNCKHIGLLQHIEPKPESCTENGNTEYYLCECGKYFSDPFAFSEITNKSSVVIKATGHDFSKADETDAYIHSEGDCKTAKTYWYACSLCGESAENEPFAYDKYYSGTELGNHKIASVLSSENGVHFYGCSVKGCSHREGEQTCYGGVATCSLLAKCEACGAGYGELLPHSFDTDEWGYIGADGHARACTADGCSAHSEVEKHSADNCEICGYVKSEPDKSGETSPNVKELPDTLNIAGFTLKTSTLIIVIVGFIGVALIITVISKIAAKKKKN